MKMQFKSMLLLLGASFFIFAGFKNEHQRDVKAIQSKNGFAPVTIVLTLTSQKADGIFTGSFTAQGAIETSGTIEMDAHFFGNYAHCSQTFTSLNGSFTAISNCEFVTNTGIWYIVSGTGNYSHLQGYGKLKMTGGGFVETWTGKVFKNQSHNDDN